MPEVTLRRKPGYVPGDDNEYDAWCDGKVCGEVIGLPYHLWVWVFFNPNGIHERGEELYQDDARRQIERRIKL